MFDRRRYLALCGTTTAGALAGCLDEGSNENNGGQNGTTDPTTVENGSNNPSTESCTGDPTELLFLSELGDCDPSYFDADARTFAGSGEAVTETIDPGSGLTAAIFEHESSSDFRFKFDNESTPVNYWLATPVREPGVRRGSGAVWLDGRPFYISVVAEGTWEITIAQPREYESIIRTPPISANGNGQSVVGPIEMTGGETISCEHRGEDSFLLKFIPEETSSHLDRTLRIGTTSSVGETINERAGMGWFNVNADGEWSLQIE